MDYDDILAALGGPADGLPHEAMQAALDRWDEAGPRFVALLAAYEAGQDRSERTERALFFAIHLLAERCETAAFAPLCGLLTDAEAADLLLGEALSETLSRILVSTFAGDPQPLRAVVEAEGADDLARHGALRALSYLTAAGRVPEPEMRAYLSHLRASMQPRGEAFVWLAWVLAVVDLGWEDMAGEAEALFDEGFVSPEFMDPEDMREDLRRTVGNPDRLAAFANDVGPLGSAIEALAAGFEAPEEEDELLYDEVREPVRNPLRNVGRNDPCPCGSGRKYKKCCLV